MKETGVVKGEILDRYAQALLSLAQDTNTLDQIGQEVNSLLEGLKSSQELCDFLASPLVKADVKKSVLNQILGNDVHPYLRSFVMLLVDRRRSMLLKGVCIQFQTLLRKLNQTVLAEVTSVYDLTDGQKLALQEKVMALTGARQVELDAKLDPELIGGVVIKIGSQIIDASLRGQLRRISLRLGSVA